MQSNLSRVHMLCLFWSLREEIKAMEVNNRELFMKFMARGRSLVNCVTEGDLEGF